MTPNFLICPWNPPFGVECLLIYLINSALSNVTLETAINKE